MTEHQEHRATIIAHNEQADAARKLELWFFRDMTDEQRLKLLSLFGLAVKGSETHGAQKLALRRILSAVAPLYTAPPVAKAEPLFREGCSYASTSGRVCNKCGHVHTEAVVLPDEKTSDTECNRPEWIWYCESTSGVPVVSLGRWPKHPQQTRYKLAEIQPTEHDHPANTALEAAVNSDVLHKEIADFLLDRDQQTTQDERDESERETSAFYIAQMVRRAAVGGSDANS